MESSSSVLSDDVSGSCYQVIGETRLRSEISSLNGARRFFINNVLRGMPLTAEYMSYLVKLRLNL